MSDAAYCDHTAYVYISGGVFAEDSSCAGEGDVTNSDSGGALD